MFTCRYRNYFARRSDVLTGSSVTHNLAVRGLSTSLRLLVAVLLFVGCVVPQAHAQSGQAASITVGSPQGDFARLGSTYTASAGKTDPTLNSEEQLSSISYSWGSTDSVSPATGSTVTVSVGPKPANAYQSTVWVTVTWYIYHKDTKQTTSVTAGGGPVNTTIYFIGTVYDPDSANNPITTWSGGSPSYVPFNPNPSNPTVSAPIGVSASSSVGFEVFADDTDRCKPIGTSTWSSIPGGTGPYSTIYQTGSGASFAADSGNPLGGSSVTESGLQSHASLTVNSNWNSEPIGVSASITDNAPTHPTDNGDADEGSAADSEVGIEWTLVPSGGCPTGMTLVSATQETVPNSNPVAYTGNLRPIVYSMTPTPPAQFAGDSINETFTNLSAVGWSMSNVSTSFQTLNPSLNTTSKILGYVRSNLASGSFVVDGSGNITDQLVGFTTLDNSDLQAIFTTGFSSAGYSMSQVFSCGGNTIHTSSIVESCTLSSGAYTISLS